jgi:cytosine deaminase
LDLDLHIDEELSDNPQGLPGWRSISPATLFPHICCSHGCRLGSDEQAAKILRQLAAHGVTLIALPMTNLLLQDGRSAARRASGDHAAQGARRRGTLLGCDNVQDAFCPAGAMTRWIPAAACSAQLSDRPAVAADLRSRGANRFAGRRGAFAVGNAASVVIFPGSDRFTWPLNSAARLVVNHGRLTHRRVWRGDDT